MSLLNDNKLSYGAAEAPVAKGVRRGFAVNAFAAAFCFALGFAVAQLALNSPASKDYLRRVRPASYDPQQAES